MLFLFFSFLFFSFLFFWGGGIVKLALDPHLTWKTWLDQLEVLWTCAYANRLSIDMVEIFRFTSHLA
jgi:hypothetical protein